jgi:hypothetical protein
LDFFINSNSGFGAPFEAEGPGRLGCCWGADAAPLAGAAPPPSGEALTGEALEALLAEPLAAIGDDEELAGEALEALLADDAAGAAPFFFANFDRSNPAMCASPLQNYQPVGGTAPLRAVWRVARAPRMSETKDFQRQGTGICTLLTVLFVGLKLTHFIGWSWWWVLAPIWLPIGVGLTVAGIACLIVIIALKWS